MPAWTISDSLVIALLEDISLTGCSHTKRGKPIAEIIPVNHQKKEKPLKETVLFIGDIMSPVAQDEWEIFK